MSALSVALAAVLGLSGCSWAPNAQFALQFRNGVIVVASCDAVSFTEMEVSIRKSLTWVETPVWAAQGEAELARGDDFVLFGSIPGMDVTHAEEGSSGAFGLTILFSDATSTHASRYDIATLYEMKRGDWLRWDETVSDEPCPDELSGLGLEKDAADESTS